MLSDMRWIETRTSRTVVGHRSHGVGADAESLARECVLRLTGPRVVAFSRRCRSCLSSEHGAPSLDEPLGIHVSWTRCEAGVFAAASDARVGIDAELTETEWPPTACWMSESERAAAAAAQGGDVAERATLARAWTVKECMVKLGRLELDDFASRPVAALVRSDDVVVHVDDWSRCTVSLVIEAAS